MTPRAQMIIDTYWMFPWAFKANGDLHVYHPTGPVVFTEGYYASALRRF